MNRSPALAMAPGDRADRLASRALQRAADGRLGVALLVVAGAWNALAAALPDGARILDSPAYAVLLGAILLTSLAAFAVRVPAAWREWRSPAPLPTGGRGPARGEVPLETPLDEEGRHRVLETLRREGYRVVADNSAPRWSAHGTKRGWSRIAGLGTHVALALLVVGAAAGTAFARETTFSLLPGDQALLDEPRPGFSDAMRLESFDAEFGADGRPRRLDTMVTFLRDGEAVERSVLQVNSPGSFGGRTIHAWTYGPAVRLRVTTLGGRPMHDAAVPLDGERAGSPAGVADLSAAGAQLGVVLLDPDTNHVAVSMGGAGGSDAALLVPGAEQRVGDFLVRLDGFEAYVTFLARSDPGGPFLVAGAAAVTAALAIAFWLPRRRLSLVADGSVLRIAVRGERFDDPSAEVERLRSRLAR
jgi:hypothetical protein